jgi:hypothetical protein
MINVLKADGKLEPFDEEKLLTSIKRAGIPPDIQDLVMEHVKSRLYENIPTDEIYSHIEEFFGTSQDHYSRSRYSLKRAIMELGPTGFPFELYVSKILEAQGYSIEVNQIMMGTCVNHEVDVIAKKDDEKLLVECKFHNKVGIKSDLHVSLYTKARFDDLKEKYGFTKAMLATNTKITSDALAFADCVDINVLSWSYPNDKGIRDLVEEHKLYPVTQLSVLNLTHKQELLSKGYVLISQIVDDPKVLDQISIPEDKREHILEQARKVSGL